METKNIALSDAGIKFEDAKHGFFAGYASRFNGVDAYGDTVLPGAYAETLKNRSRPIHMRFNHLSQVIGKWIKAEEDDTGLYVEGQLTPEHSLAKDVYASMKFGAVDGLSIGYHIPSGGSQKDGKIRRLKRLDLIEISVVESPADLGARIGNVKSVIDECASLKEVEAMLRDVAGFSRNDATALVSRVKLLTHGDRGVESKAVIASELTKHISGRFKF